jgi:hypothetical protein
MTIRGWIQCLNETTWRLAEDVEVFESPFPAGHPMRAFDTVAI